MMDNTKIIFLIFISWIFQQKGICQTSPSKYDVYSNLISQSVFDSDTTFDETTESIFITTLEKDYELDDYFDTKYLEGYLTGNLSNHPLREQFKDRPTAYFDMPPSFGFGKELQKDSTYGFLILKLKKLLDRKNDLKNNFITDYEIRLVKSPKKYFKMGWEKFHDKYKNCLGVIRVSDVAFSSNGNLAALLIEDFRGSLFGSGNIVFLERLNNKWTIKYYLNLWIS